MSKQSDFDPLLGRVRTTDKETVLPSGGPGTSSSTGGGTGVAFIPQYNDTDPASPTAQDAWVLRSGSASTGGSPIGLLLALTEAGGGGYSYQFSYYTQEGTIIRAALS